jgi:hypothetical protein
LCSFRSPDERRTRCVGRQAMEWEFGPGPGCFTQDRVVAASLEVNDCDPVVLCLRDSALVDRRRRVHRVRCDLRSASGLVSVHAHPQEKGGNRPLAELGVRPTDHEIERCWRVSEIRGDLRWRAILLEAQATSLVGRNARIARASHSKPPMRRSRRCSWCRAHMHRKSPDPNDLGPSLAVSSFGPDRKYSSPTRRQSCWPHNSRQ